MMTAQRLVACVLGASLAATPVTMAAADQVPLEQSGSADASTLEPIRSADPITLEPTRTVDPSTLEQIGSNADRVRIEAQGIHQLLRAKAPDFADVTLRMSTLQTHADALKQSLTVFDVAGARFTDAQGTAFVRAGSTTETLLVLLTNKSRMLADTAGHSRNRISLRAQAEGIVKRAEMVQQAIAKIRG